MTADQSMRIALLAPLVSPIPPPGYAGTERIVATLAQHLHERGHEVTLFAAGDSEVDCRLVPVVPQSLWATGYQGDGRELVPLVLTAAWREIDRFDIIHSHLEGGGFLLGRHGSTPFVTTLHNRLDTDGMPQLIEGFADVPLVSISESQRRWAPKANWVATIHHGIVTPETLFGQKPGDYLLLVGRVTYEKGVAEAIEVARESGLTLKLAGKVHQERERRMYEELVQPAIAEGIVDFVGEVDPNQRDALFAGARATLMLGAWPEPFGLVAIESMATGTPVIGRRAGALPETVHHGETGFLVDDMTEAKLAVARVTELDRKAIRQSALERFSPEVMIDRYEEVYRRLIAA